LFLAQYARRTRLTFAILFLLHHYDAPLTPRFEFAVFFIESFRSFINASVPIGLKVLVVRRVVRKAENVYHYVPAASLDAST